MQDPKKDIPKVVHTLMTTRDANELENTIKHYFLPDAKFLHPLANANSRDEILGLFQWVRVASPKLSIQVDNVMYDADLNVAVVEIRERFHEWFNPLPSMASRMVIRLKLRKTNGYHKIELEEDFMHPTDLMGFFASPLVPLVAMSLRVGCLISNLGACVFRSVGLNSGLKGGTINYAGLLGAAGLARTAKVGANGSANKEC
ncbi:hypothetical protein JVU11DRAFT_2694 [Chiua virens]|nr:hypothetical protein JVU11DRAFT_2694 [Chiua virens]